MVHPVIVPLTGTNQTPEATGMVNNNIFEINKNRETDSPKNDQERHGYIKPIMISHYHRITQITRQCRKSGITES